MKYTIAIPAYKSEFLKDCIQSILVQTFEDFELIIVNDASPENIDEVVHSFSDHRIRYYKNEENFNLKLEIHSKIQKLPRNSAKTRIRNRCWKTGRPRGVFSDFGISRHVFREMAHQCLLPGITKSSW